MPTQETPSTPGAVAYAAYTAVLALTFPRTWDDVSPTMPRAWEAAAQAVRAMDKEEEPCGSTVPRTP